jgi:hypothetical protein
VNGIGSHGVPILVTARLLKPPGNSQKIGIKFFATAELLELAKYKTWLVKVTNAVNQHWQRNNASKKDQSQNCKITASGSGNNGRDNLPIADR